MFAFEFAVLTILSLSTTARYALSLYETAVIKRQIAHGREQLRHRTESPLSEEEANATDIDAAGWEEKGQWVFYLDIATGASPAFHDWSECVLILERIRLLQTCPLPHLLLCFVHVLRHANSYHSRCRPYHPIIL